MGDPERRTAMNWRPTLLLLVALLGLAACGGGEPAADDPTTTTQPAPPPTVAGDVFVDTAQVIQAESFPVQVRLDVAGSLPTPCHEARWEVTDDGAVISVRLWSLAEQGQACVQVLEPFQAAISLGSFESGERSVVLNGEEVGRFSLGTASPTLIEAGWSFGMCLGFCTVDLVVDGDAVVLAGRDREEDDPLFVNAGTLTPEGRESIDAALRRLGDTPLQPVYGCPDCADGGAAYVVLEREAITSRHDFDFGSPPPVLSDLYALTKSIIDGLRECTSSALFTAGDDCAPWEGS